MNGLSKYPQYDYLHDGINYQVYRTSDNCVMKHYQSEDQQELQWQRNLLYSEQLICAYGEIFLCYKGIEILEEDIYVIYEGSYLNIIDYVKREQALSKQKDQEVLKELFDDDQEIQQEENINIEGLEKMVLDLIFELYVLETKGIIVPNIKASNMLVNEDRIIIMDVLNASEYFEQSLEEYLQLVDKKLKTPVNQLDQINQLGRICQMVAQNYSDGFRRLVDCMMGKKYTFFGKLIESEEYVDVVAQYSKEMKQMIKYQFVDRQKQLAEQALTRVGIRQRDDLMESFWNQTIQQNLQILKTPLKEEQFEFKTKQLIRVTGLKCSQINVISLRVYQGLNRCIILSTLEGYVLIFDKQHELIFKFSCCKKPIFAMLNMDNQFIIVAGEEGIMYVYTKIQLEERKEEPFVKLHQNQPIYVLKYIQCDFGKLFLNGDKAGVVRIYKNWNLINEIQCHSGRVSEIQFLNSFEFLSSSFDKLVKLWDLRALEKERNILVGHLAEVVHVSCWNDEIYSFSSDGLMRVWRRKGFLIEFCYQSKLSVSKSQWIGHFLLMSDSSGYIVVYDTKERIVKQKFKAHLSYISDFRWLAHTNNSFISCGFDGIIRIIG